ncbi:MAG: DNA-directed RNA polymerase subunit beta [Elusimicrobia bacterium]|nr:DNA-directed RNA polymerase subunit beta [Elusimicrobiota bacterium]
MNQINFSKIPPAQKLQDLLEMQKRSFEDFLQLEIPHEERKIQGLQASFLDVFPIDSSDGGMVLDFVKYSLGAPRYSSVEEAAIRDGTYSAPLKAVLRLSSRQPSGKLKEIIEQEVVLCELPLMTENASFIINGAERVVVSQLHRSPGIIFEEDEEKKISSLGKKLYFARIIPYRGAWIEFEFDLNNALYVRMDRKKKFPATTFLKACGIESDAEILQLFYLTEEVSIKAGHTEQYLRRIVAEDVVDKSSGEVLVEARHPLTQEGVRRLLEKKIASIRLIQGDPEKDSPTILETLRRDPFKSVKEAQQEIYKKMRGQEFVVPGQAEQYLDNLIFKNLRKYDLSYVGRYKTFKKIRLFFERLVGMKEKVVRGYKMPSARERMLTVEDILVTMQYVIALNNGDTTFEYKGEKCAIEVDDIDHLGNRRVRGVGELLESQIRVGLSQMSRVIRERMSVQDKALLTPRSLLNAAPVVGILRKFFGTSQLSQFMDQINPLAEMTHKRRLSALGPGGLHRKRAGFEVRDVHYTHYGRICPIETPEGPNIGLITSLACHARVNEYGLIESPYREVTHGKVTDKVDYLTADRENDVIVAQANAPLEGNRLAADMIACRHRGDFPLVEPVKIHYMDISPMQVVSISAALIPFLEHDDANRALMGSNMQRQAVPLLVAEPPLVATGVEARVAEDSGAMILAKRPGKVIYSSADIVAVNTEEGGEAQVDIYTLKKYRRSNQDTCINQVPVAEVGQRVSRADVLVDGPATSRGQLALGKNLLVAFMPWEGYNFEDAILVSEKLVKEDIFTSIHIQQFEVEARDTKLGSEEITRDIPNVGAEALEYLDEQGIVIPSTMVRPGDILVGKVTPKGEQQITPEERLLKVIFGKKAEDVQDASLRVPPGVTGKVIGVRVFVRREKLSKVEERKRMEGVGQRLEGQIANLKAQRKEALTHLENVKSSSKRKEEEERIQLFYKLMEKKFREDAQREQDNIKRGDELPVTVNKVVKVYIASRRKLQVGDKVAGRHGNKGVIARILPSEDMPFLPDGTPVDVVLSPLGVPSRMNVGQLLETMLGWAAYHLNTQMVCPVFDGAKEAEVLEMVKKAKEDLRKRGVPERYLPSDDCRITLYDGRTGEPFQEKVTIGYMYLMKLVHLVEDKIHARSTGPYSLITRQPLGGKAQFGGQRFGEMEVWAVEGYGAAYALQEFLTVKSDDVVGRAKMYEAIIKGEPPQQPGVPESFKVLVKELQALGLNVELLKLKNGKGKDAGTVSDGKKAAAKT